MALCLQTHFQWTYEECWYLFYVVLPLQLVVCLEKKFLFLSSHLLKRSYVKNSLLYLLLLLLPIYTVYLLTNIHLYTKFKFQKINKNFIVVF